MSCTTKLSRACQPGYYLSYVQGLRQCSAVTHSCRYKSSKADAVPELVIDNVMEDPPVNYHPHFNHIRRRRPETTLPMAKIVYKKKDTIPKIYPSLEERLSEMDPKLSDPELYRKVNIGMSHSQVETNSEKRKRQKNMIHSLRSDKNLAKLANDHKLEVDISAVCYEWLTDGGPFHIRQLALHCGIFKDLFGPYAFFDALVPLHIEYDFNDEEVSLVYRGNIIKPAEARSVPRVEFTSPPDALWTLVLTNPDGDLYKADSECCHWMVTNIRGSDVTTGDVVVPYLPPVPPHGVGYQRMVFVLYRQGKDVQHSVDVADPHDLRLRSFSTAEFYRQHEADITPVGLAWYNTDWDDTMPQYYHQTLGMKEPVFEYVFPGPYIKPEEETPIRRNFAEYTDRYRDPKLTNEIILTKRLKTIDPFKKQMPRLPFPSAQPINPNMPSWQRQLIKQERLGWGRFRELYRDDYSVDASIDDGALTEAATVEVEKNHSARMGRDWRKIYLGKKKKTVVLDDQKNKETEERVGRVTIANLD